jgi:hypothetical protein
VGCSRQFSVKNLLEKHFKHAHSDERPFPCPEYTCSYKSKTQKDLNRHIKNRHSQRDLVPGETIHDQSTADQPLPPQTTPNTTDIALYFAADELFP